MNASHSRAVRAGARACHPRPASPNAGRRARPQNLLRHSSDTPLTPTPATPAAPAISATRHLSRTRHLSNARHLSRTRKPADDASQVRAAAIS